MATDLTSDEGILYGINRHNNSLIIFDRFSLENANSVIFAKAGAGKSYAAKLEILRSLMMGTDVLIVDPENEYKRLADSVGGSFFKISLSSEHQINPFDIPVIPEDEDPADIFKSHVLNLTGLIKLMLGGKVTPEEDALLDKAILKPTLPATLRRIKRFFQSGRAAFGRSADCFGEYGKRPGLAQRLEKYTRGTYAGFVNRPTNIDIKNRLIVFSVRDLEEELRPIAMYIVLNFVWTLVKAQLKKNFDH